MYDTLYFPLANLTRTAGVGGSGAEGASGKTPEYNKEEIEEHVNWLYRWEWRTLDGTYSAFEKGQSIKIETCFRQGNWGTQLADTEVPVFSDETRKYLVDFVDMTVQMGGDSWATAIRCKVVETAFFDRERKDKKEPRILRRTHTIKSVRRVQNRVLLGLFQAQCKVMEEKRGKDKVELTCSCCVIYCHSKILWSKLLGYTTYYAEHALNPA